MSDLETIHQDLHRRMHDMLAEPGPRYTQAEESAIRELTELMQGLTPTLQRIDLLMKALERPRANPDVIQFSEPPS